MLRLISVPKLSWVSHLQVLAAARTMKGCRYPKVEIWICHANWNIISLCWIDLFDKKCFINDGLPLRVTSVWDFEASFFAFVILVVWSPLTQNMSWGTELWVRHEFYFPRCNRAYHEMAVVFEEVTSFPFAYFYDLVFVEESHAHFKRADCTVIILEHFQCPCLKEFQTKSGYKLSGPFIICHGCSATFIKGGNFLLLNTMPFFDNSKTHSSSQGWLEVNKMAEHLPLKSNLERAIVLAR